MELKTESVAAEKHSREKKQQQRGNAEAIAPLADDDADENKHRAHKEDIFWCECHINVEFRCPSPLLRSDGRDD